MTKRKKHPLYQAQLRRVLEEIDLTPYNGSTIFVTGGTGMIGACILDLLSLWNELGGEISLVSSTRDVSNLEEYALFGVQWIAWDSLEPLVVPPSLPEINYIIHTASNADPINFSQFPVDTLLGTVTSTASILDYARTHNTKRVLYLSSGEMYGNPQVDDLGVMRSFQESFCGALDHANPRACYPVGKRAAEVLCQSYIRQFSADVVIARLCHIFGPTMKGSDSRASSEFLRNGANGQPIVMKSAGLLERSHCYVVDCVSALLFLLDKGETGEAYNVADERYQMTIRDFAQKTAACSGVDLIFEQPSDIEMKGYSQVSRAVLNGDKLKKLGWSSCAMEGKGTAISDTVTILKETFC